MATKVLVPPLDHMLDATTNWGSFCRSKCHRPTLHPIPIKCTPMFYSELLSSPINAYNIKRLYGIDPDADPTRAALIGIYPLTEAPEGYSPTTTSRRVTATPLSLTSSAMLSGNRCTASGQWVPASKSSSATASPTGIPPLTTSLERTLSTTATSGKRCRHQPTSNQCSRRILRKRTLTGASCDEHITYHSVVDWGVNRLVLPDDDAPRRLASC